MKNKFGILILNLFLQLFFLKGFSQEEEVVLKTITGNINGTLMHIEKKADIPVVLIIAGSGPTDRNGNQSETENNSLKFLAQELSKSGIASLRYDKRGVAESKEAVNEESELRFETYINDVKEWVNFLSTRKTFSKIILAGHSEGSLLAIVAAINNKKVNAFISIAGVGRPADEIIKEQLEKIPQNVKDIVYPMVDKIKKGDTIPNVPPMLMSLFRPSVQPYMTSWFKYDPQQEIKKLNIPILIVQGSTDIQVTEKDAELLAKANPSSDKKIITNMNHVLKDCTSKKKEDQTPIYSNSELPLNKDFTNEVITFIKKLK